MPKLFEYFGLVLFFYSNEHEPIHVHARIGGREGRAEFLILDGMIQSIVFKDQSGKEPLSPREKSLFEEIVHHKKQELVESWISYFVWHKNIECQNITRRLP